MTSGDNSYGNPDLWSKAFPTTLIPIILSLIIETWPRCLSEYKFTSGDHEIRITRRLKYLLQEEKNLRALPLRIEREVSEESVEDDVEEKGRIDLMFTNGYRENVYFAFECKRLNVNYKGKKHSLAGDYVGKDGLLAFVKEWYSVGLEQSGMIGYVMDGDSLSAQSKVNKKIKDNKHKLKTSNGLLKSSVFKSSKQLKETKHLLSSHALLVHHIFLSVKHPIRNLIW